MTIFLSSDHHFGHANILKFLAKDGVTRIRPEFSSVAEMNEVMVERHNALVKPTDHWWCLGDIAMSPNSLHWVSKLNGIKRIILGNHDKNLNILQLRNVGFKKIQGSSLNSGVLMTHFPVHPMSIGFKVIGNAHGHIHEKSSPSPLHLNMSVEKWNYAPVPLELVVETLRAQRGGEGLDNRPVAVVE